MKYNLETLLEVVCLEMPLSSQEGKLALVTQGPVHRTHTWQCMTDTAIEDTTKLCRQVQCM